MYTRMEVAKALSVSKETVSRWIRSRNLPRLPGFRRVLIPAVGLEQWVSENSRYNHDRAGLAVRNPTGERSCISARRRKVSTAIREVSTGRHLSQMKAVQEFDALLGRPTRGKR
ncbi:MAG: helix-turn-helix domain-containing protein [Proteobacteria bacterium]|nr:helix-turn-helix domain-containing protein [Pseudomonadota bacterium]